MPPVQTAAGGAAIAELVALHSEGQLAKCYPRVTRLTADLSGNDLCQAGRLLTQLDPAEIIGYHPDTVTIRVAITGNGTVAECVPALTAELARHGIVLQPYLASFGSYIYGLSDPDSGIYAARPDLVLCIVDPAMILDELPTPWRAEDAESLLTEKIGLVERLAAKFQASCPGTLVLNTLPLTQEITGQLVDAASRARLSIAWREANIRLLRLAITEPAVAVLDLDPMLAEAIAVSEPRMSVYAKAHLSAELLARYARDVGHLARRIAGKGRKCLVLDLDETVWGGVLSEDGRDGIQVEGSYRGEAFRAFQKAVKQLAAQGVLLAAVSKNEADEVRQVLRDHPGMTLREDDFVRITANWRPKHENLRELAAELNIGVDSIVFADDSAHECGLVRAEIPEIAVVQLDDEPALHIEKTLRDGWFDVRELTAEDRARPVRYQEELSRKDFLHSFDSLAGYLHELDLRVRFGSAAERDVPRISQLTLRTNQFNLTTQRLQPAEVHALLSDPAALVLTIHSADRFGDNGLVGAVLARRDNDIVQISNFLLSCRVFSRGIEQACLSSLLRYSRRTGASGVTGTYRPTAKNSAMRNFFPRYGFIPVTDDGHTLTFRHDLSEIISPPDHIRLVEGL
jgi:FkbH-like protein